MKFLQGLFSRVKGWFSGIWEKTERRDRTRFLVISGIALTLIIAALIMLNSGNYTQIATINNAVSMRTAQNTLTDNNITFKTSGSNLLVNKKDESEASYLIAMSDVDLDDIDLSIYERGTSMTSTAEDRRNYKWYQKEIHLKKLFEAMPMVDRANIIIEVPENKGIFRGEDQPSTVAVVLYLNAEIGLGQIDTIEKLVQNATNIAPENIAISDQSFRHLNKKEEMTANTSMAQQYEYVKGFERDLEGNISRMLHLLIGSGNYSVGVSARFNFDAVSSQSVVFEPVVDDEGIARSIQRIDEYAKGSGYDGGYPGTDENGIGEEYAEVIEALMNEYKRLQETINYEINETNTWTEREPAVLEDITVSVLINTNGLADELLTSAAKTEVQQLVGGLVGMRAAEAANKVTVSLMPMDGVEKANADRLKWEEEVKRQETFALIQTLTLYLIIGVCVILLIMRAFALLKPPPVELPEIMLAGDADEYAELLEAAAANMELEVTKTPSRERIEEFINSNPEAVASMLRTWLQDEDEKGW